MTSQIEILTAQITQAKADYHAGKPIYPRQEIYKRRPRLTVNNTIFISGLLDIKENAGTEILFQFLILAHTQLQ